MRFLNWLVDKLYRERSNAWKAAFSTTLIAFTMALIGSVTTLLGSVQEWLGDGDTEALLNDLKVQAKIAFSAAVALFIGIGNYILRWAQSKFSFIPGTGPTYGGTAQPE